MIIPSVKLSGKIIIPSSKSQTIRALLISVFSRGVSYIKHPLISDDTESCINAVKAMGADVSILENGNITVDATYAFSDMDELGSEHAIKEAGKLRLEGKDYVVQDGDVMHFRFNV